MSFLTQRTRGRSKQLAVLPVTALWVFQRSTSCANIAITNGEWKIYFFVSLPVFILITRPDVYQSMSLSVHNVLAHMASSGKYDGIMRNSLTRYLEFYCSICVFLLTRSSSMTSFWQMWRTVVFRPLLQVLVGACSTGRKKYSNDDTRHRYVNIMRFLSTFLPLQNRLLCPLLNAPGFLDDDQFSVQCSH